MEAPPAGDEFGRETLQLHGASFSHVVFKSPPAMDVMDPPLESDWKQEKTKGRLLEPETSIYKWLFQLDDSKSLHRKWLFHQTSI